MMYHHPHQVVPEKTAPSCAKYPGYIHYLKEKRTRTRRLLCGWQTKQIRPYPRISIGFPFQAQNFDGLLTFGVETHIFHIASGGDWIIIMRNPWAHVEGVAEVWGNAFHSRWRSTRPPLYGGDWSWGCCACAEHTSPEMSENETPFYENATGAVFNWWSNF